MSRLDGCTEKEEGEEVSRGQVERIKKGSIREGGVPGKERATDSNNRACQPRWDFAGGGRW